MCKIKSIVTIITLIIVASCGSDKGGSPPAPPTKTNTPPPKLLSVSEGEVFSSSNTVTVSATIDESVDEVMLYSSSDCSAPSELLASRETRANYEDGIPVSITGSNESVEVYISLFSSGETLRECEPAFTYTHDDLAPSDTSITTDFTNNSQDVEVGGTSTTIQLPLDDLVLDGSESHVLICGDSACSIILAEVPVGDIQSGGSYTINTSSSPSDTPTSIYVATRDEAGNNSTPQDTGRTYTVDTLGPDAAVSISLEHSGVSRTTSTETDISFDVDSNNTESLTVLVNSVPQYTLSDVTTNSISAIDLPLVLNETNTITLESFDQYGNTSTQTLVVIEQTNQPPSEEAGLLAIDGDLSGSASYSIMTAMDTSTESLDLSISHEDTTTSSFGPFTNAQIVSGESVTLKEGINDLTFTLTNDVGLTSEFTYQVEVETDPPAALVPTAFSQVVIDNGSDPISPTISFESHPRVVTYSVQSHTASPQNGDEDDLTSGIVITLDENQMNNVDIEITDSVGNSFTQTIEIFQGYPERGEIKEISIGKFSTCAIGTLNGHVKCWGNNSFMASVNNVLGYGSPSTTFGHELPENMPALDFGERADKIFVGYNQACVILESGSVKCWGGNFFGQLGYGDNTDRTGLSATAHPNLLLPAGVEVVDMHLSQHLTCAEFDDETVRCWGTSTSIPNAELTPRDAPVLASGVKSFSTSYIGTTCYSDALGDLYCFGRNDYGQAGVSSTSATIGTPTKVDMDGAFVSKVFTGQYSTCAILQNNEIKCWGKASFISGQHASSDTLGDDETPGSLQALSIPRGNPLKMKLEDGGCVETDLGEVYCWGNNYISSTIVPYSYAPLSTEAVLPDANNNIFNLSFSNYMQEEGGFSIEGSILTSRCLKSNSTGGVYCFGSEQEEIYALGYGDLAEDTEVSELSPIKFYPSFTPEFTPPQVAISSTTLSYNDTSTTDSTIEFSIEDFPRQLSYEVLTHNVSAGSSTGNEQDLVDGIIIDLVANAMNDIVIKIVNSSGQEKTLTISVYQGTEPLIGSSVVDRDLFYFDDTSVTSTENLATSLSDYAVSNNIASISTNFYSPLSDDNTMEGTTASQPSGGQTEANSSLDNIAAVTGTVTQGEVNTCAYYVYNLENLTCTDPEVSFGINMLDLSSGTRPTGVGLIANGSKVIDVPVSPRRIREFSTGLTFPNNTDINFYLNDWYYFDAHPGDFDINIYRYNHTTNERELVVDLNGISKAYQAGDYIYMSSASELFEYDASANTIRKIMDMGGFGDFKLAKNFGTKVAILARKSGDAEESIFVAEQGSGSIERVGDTDPFGNDDYNPESFRNLNDIGLVFTSTNGTGGGGNSIFLYNGSSNQMDKIYDFDYDSSLNQVMGVVDNIITFAAKEGGNLTFINFYISGSNYMKLYTDGAASNFSFSDLTRGASNDGYIYRNDGKVTHLYIDGTSIERNGVFIGTDELPNVSLADSSTYLGDSIILFPTVNLSTSKEDLYIFNQTTGSTTRLTDFSSPTEVGRPYINGESVYFRTEYNGDSTTMSKVDLGTGDVESSFLGFAFFPNIDDGEDRDVIFEDGMIFLDGIAAEQ